MHAATFKVCSQVSSPSLCIWQGVGNIRRLQFPGFIDHKSCECQRQV
ncbi:hypothetical protein AMB3_3898 [plant metagenome]